MPEDGLSVKLYSSRKSPLSVAIRSSCSSKGGASFDMAKHSNRRFGGKRGTAEYRHTPSRRRQRDYRQPHPRERAQRNGRDSRPSALRAAARSWLVSTRALIRGILAPLAPPATCSSPVGPWFAAAAGRRCRSLPCGNRAQPHHGAVAEGHAQAIQDVILLADGRLTLGPFRQRSRWSCFRHRLRGANEPLNQPSLMSDKEELAWIRRWSCARIAE